MNLNTLFKAFVFWLSEYKFCRTNNPPVNKTLLIVKVDGIGDYVLFRNFIEILKNSKRFQGYRFIFCGNTSVKDLAETLDSRWIDQFIWVNQDLLVNRLSYRKQLFEKIKQLGAETVIQPTFSRDYFAGDSLVKAIEAPQKIGSQGNCANTPPWLKKWADALYSHLIPADPTPMFEFNRNKEFFEQLLDSPIGLSQAYIDWQDKEPLPIKSPYLILFPGAGQDTRRWPIACFIETATQIQKETGLHVVIAGDSSTMAGITHNSFQAIITKSLTDLTALINGCSLLICNDTGAAHLGAALYKPVVCISNGSSSIRFHPYPDNIHHFSVVYPSPDIIKKQAPWRIKTISVDQVTQAATSLLSLYNQSFRSPPSA